MKDVLLVVNVVNSFDHEDGGALQASFRERLAGMVQALQEARDWQVPVVYADDSYGDWRGDRDGFVRRAKEGAGGDVVAALAPRPERAFPVQAALLGRSTRPRSRRARARDRGDRTPRPDGAATEGCVVQTAIDARERGLMATIIDRACATADQELEEIALAYAARVGGVRLAASLVEARRGS